MLTNDQKVLSTLVYLVRADQVLMLHRIKKKGDIHKDKYNGLGGKIEPGEGPLDCAKREVWEESGLKVESIHFKGNLYFPKFDKQGRDWQVYLYRVDQFSGTLKESSHEGDLKWFNQDELFNLNLWEGDKIFLKHVFSPRIIDGTFYYQDGKLVDHKLEVLAN